MLLGLLLLTQAMHAQETVKCGVDRWPVKIALDPKDPLTGQLRPGLSVTATVDTRTVQAATPQPTVNQAQR